MTNVCLIVFITRNLFRILVCHRLLILGGRLVGVKTIGKPSSGRQKGGRRRLYRGVFLQYSD